MSVVTNTPYPVPYAQIRASMVRRVNQRYRTARCALRSCMLRIGQQRLIHRLRCLGDHHGAAVVVARRDKTRRHVVAEERDLGAVDAVRERQCTPGLIAIR